MAFVADFHVVQTDGTGKSPGTGQARIPARSPGVVFPFGTQIDDNQEAVFQLMYRGLQRSSAAVFVNDRKVVDLRPYSFAGDGDWFQWTFLTPPGVVRQDNSIRFDGADEDYFVCNVFCMARQEA